MNKREYDRFVAAFNRGVDGLHFNRGVDGLHFLSSGPMRGCDGCEWDGELTDSDIENYEPGFSWSECEVCGSRLGGKRYPMHGYTADDQLVHMDACEDCIYMLKYGKLDDMTMMSIEDSDAR